MTELQLFDLVRQAVSTAAVMSAPMLAMALVVGLGVGLVQALTSVQEQTLTFVPKAAAMLAIFWVTMGFMTSALVRFFTDTIVPTIAGS
jgi:flagellar biosynthetic protein FliQ